MTLDNIGTVLLYLATGSTWLFIILYSTYAAWYRSTPGRHIMAATTLLGIIMLYLILSNAGVLAGMTTVDRQVVRVMIYGALFLIMTWRVWILIKVQVRRRNRERTRK